MDIDAIRRAAEALAEAEAIDREVTLEEENDDLGQPVDEDWGEQPGQQLTVDASGAPEQEEALGPEPDVIDDDHLGRIVEAAIQNAVGYEDEVSADREAALDYYFGRSPAPPAKEKKPGAIARSSVVSKDVADMTEAVLSQTLQAFIGNDLAKFEPANEQDEEQAAEESNYLNWVFVQDCRGASKLHDCFKDALTQDLGIAKAYWDETTRIVYDEYHDLTPMELPQALAPKRPGEEVEVVGYEMGEPAQPGPMPGAPGPMPGQGQAMQAQPMPGQGQPMPGPQVPMPGQAQGMPPQGMVPQAQGMMPPGQPQQPMQTFSIRVRRRWSQSKPRVTSVAPENFVYSPRHDSLYLADCQFCAERRILTQSELLDMGFDEEVVRGLPSYSGENEPTARQRSEREGYYEELHDSVRPIEVYECYIVIDRDGDGFAELLRVFWSSREILEVEETDNVPYALACPFPTPHRVRGEGMYSKLKNVQDVKTEMLRLSIDNATANTYGRYEVEERMINLNDFLGAKPAGVVRSKRIGSVAPIPIADIGQGPLSVMTYMDKVRQEGGGPALDMQSENIPVNTQTAHGTERVMTAMEQLASRIAGTFADTLVGELYRLLHALVLKHGKGELTARMPNGHFIVTDPRNWQERERVTITIGKTLGERMRSAAALTQVLDYQMQAMQNGGDGVMVDLAHIHNALIDLGRSSGLLSPEQYWIDPASPESQQALQMKAQQAQQQAQMQQQQMQMLIQVQMQLQQIQEETKRMKARLDHQGAVAKLATEGLQHAEDNALKLTELEVTQSQQAEQEYQRNLVAMQRPQGQAKQQSQRRF